MTDQTQTTQTANTPDPIAEAKQQLQGVDREYFGPNDRAKAYERWQELNKLAEVLNLKPVFNFSKAGDIPQDYGMGIIPLTRRSEVAGGGNIVENFVIGAFPTPELVAAHDKGPVFIESLIQSALFNKLANAAKPRGDKAKAREQLPFSVADFVVTQRRTGELVTWRKIRQPFLDRVKKQHPAFETLDYNTFRAILENAAVAEQHYRTVPQDRWNSLLDAMLAYCEANKLEPGAIKVWRDTRMAQEIEEVSDLDLSAFDDIGDVDAEESETDAAA